jgi:hypothetical protein
MGNSLPHLLRDEDLQASVESFGAALRRSGLLVLQIVNFERILSSGERVQSVRESGGTIYVRFYDLEGTSVRFNILRLTKHPTGVSHDLRSVNLRPISRGAIVDLLSAAGFEDPQVYGGVAGEGYDPGSSRDLVVFAVRRSS